MEEKEIIIRPHYLTAFCIYFVKFLIFIVIIIFSFKIINKILGYDLIMSIVDTLRIAIGNIMELDSSITSSLGIEFLEDNIFNIFLTTLILAFVKHSTIINKSWQFTSKEFKFGEGIFSIKKTILPLENIIRVYTVAKADFKNIGDIYIELSTREKKLKLPCVFHTDDLVKEISKRVDKYKESIIEKDIERDLIEKRKVARPVKQL